MQVQYATDDRVGGSWSLETPSQVRRQTTSEVDIGFKLSRPDGGVQARFIGFRTGVRGTPQGLTRERVCAMIRGQAIARLKRLVNLKGPGLFFKLSVGNRWAGGSRRGDRYSLYPFDRFS